MLKYQRPHLSGMVILVLLPIMLSVSPQRVVAESCNLVELRPGYPGYLGYVTGVDGIGDHACEEELEREDPSFSKRDEDRENRRAAQRLGIRGSEELWTWENWLAIESERGLTSTCYWCAFANAEQRGVPPYTDIEYSDPRLQCGTFGDNSVLEAYAMRNGIGYFGDTLHDYAIRAVAVLTSGEAHLNAKELIDAYADILDNYHTAGGSVPNFAYYWDVIVWRGGYFELPAGATVDDQIFLVLLAIEPFKGYFPGPFWNAISIQVTTAAEEWRMELARGSNMSFREYLAEERVLQDF